MLTPSGSCGVLDALPDEILIEILALAPDVQSLWNIASTCRNLYYMVTNPTLNLPHRVISRRINRRVINFAFTAADARTREGWLMSWLPNRRMITSTDVQNGLERMPTKWTMRTIFAMDRLHNTVEELSERLIADMIGQQVGTQLPVSLGELWRVQNAFYRAEIFCLLTEIQPIRYYWERQLNRNFFLRFAAWENEQVACIWDWLDGGAHNAIHSLSKLDLTWANYMDVMQQGRVPRSKTEFYKFKGLDFMLALIRATTREELVNCLGPDPRKSHTNFYMSSILADLDPRDHEDDVSMVVEYLHNVHYDEPLQMPIIADRDYGPEGYWCWAHPNLGASSFVFGRAQRKLRQSGYVLWDYKRTSEKFQNSWTQRPLVPAEEEEKADARVEAASFKGYLLALGQETSLDYDQVSAMIERNVLQYEGYSMEIHLTETG